MLTLELGKPRAVRRLRLLTEVLATYVQARWLLWRGDLPSSVATLRNVPPKESFDDPFERFLVSQRLTRAVLRTLPLLPTESRCLMRSLVLLGLLARRGIDADIVIAVKAGPDFFAHAWIESEGRALLATQEDVFSRVATL